MFDNMGKEINYVRENLSIAARYEQLAEEASELSQAALKMARIERGENPTSTSYCDAISNLYEEYADVLVAASSIDIPPKVLDMIGQSKIKRWKSRIENRNA